ncbi:hypothetical protein SRHO_G00077020 [Serrasalmus rhombeus]
MLVNLLNQGHCGTVIVFNQSSLPRLQDVFDMNCIPYLSCTEGPRCLRNTLAMRRQSGRLYGAFSSPLAPQGADSVGKFSWIEGNL